MSSEENLLSKISQPVEIISESEKKVAQQEYKDLFLNDDSKKAIRRLSKHSILLFGYLTLVVVFLVVSVRVFHYIGPECYYWISPENIKSLDNLIIGVLAGLSARFFPNFRAIKNND